MADKYRFSVMRDDDKKIIISRIAGPMPSAEIMEHFLNAYRELETPWLYKRLVDYRKFEGMIDYADIEYFSRQWAALIGNNTHNSRVAIVTHDALELARTSTVDHLFPHDIVRAFETMDQALDWFDEP